MNKELTKFGLFSREELERLGYISDTLALDREPSFYGTWDGTPASELYDKEDAQDAIEKTLWLIERI
jgi:hypothetical protein